MLSFECYRKWTILHFHRQQTETELTEKWTKLSVSNEIQVNWVE